MASGVNPNKAKAEKSAQGITLSDAIEQVLSEKSSVLKKTTIGDYRKVLLRHFSDWGNRPIGRITTQDITKRYTQIREGIKKRSRVTKATTNPTGEADAQKAMRYLSAIFSHFETDYAGDLPVLPQGNVVKVLAKKRIRPPIKRRERTLNLSERLALIDILWGEEAGKIGGSQRDWVLLLMLTGLRYHEPLSMRWENIDWSLKVFTITDTKNGEHLTLPMTKFIEYILKNRKREQEDSEIQRPVVFPQRSDPMKSATMTKVIQKVSKVVGFEFNAHDLRRTTATALAELGYDLTIIERVLNHARANITDKYINTNVEKLRRALEKLDWQLFGMIHEIPQK
ncbi:MAG: hypothetical protein CMD66_00770 [Gammaproteobacteria bacterium]|nr:hypothetical protein [Gammaproteobacteria bacterium]|tara:strand:+ start:314 stop:1333 length:1020 start_codon:yes stop_codon:yes gene_type:complete